jgi:hypothetical protein
MLEGATSAGQPARGVSISSRGSHAERCQGHRLNCCADRRRDPCLLERIADPSGVFDYIMITAVFMVVAMWIFPEAGVKKGDKAR